LLEQLEGQVLASVAAATFAENVVAMRSAGIRFGNRGRVEPSDLKSPSPRVDDIGRREFGHRDVRCLRDRLLAVRWMEQSRVAGEAVPGKEADEAKEAERLKFRR